MSRAIGAPLLYAEGQHDMLRRLRGDVPADDDSMAPIALEVVRSYALWCLGHNLAVIGALAKASGRHRIQIGRVFAQRRKAIGITVGALAVAAGLPPYEIEGFMAGVSTMRAEDKIRAALDKFEAERR